MQTIKMDNATKRFYQGAASANDVLKAHEGVDFPDHETRVRLFWFYVGALAGGEHGCQTEPDFSNFILGANARAPQPPDSDHEDDDETLGSCGCVDYHMADCPTRTAAYSPDPYDSPHGL